MKNLVPIGVEISILQAHKDERGVFTELFRASWIPATEFVQWNAVNSEAGVLRGVHVHLKHHDYLTVLKGRVLFGLKDLRKNSPTEGMIATIEITANHPQTLHIPPGVAHGFYFLEPSTHIYAVSEYWDLADELGCRYDDDALQIKWPNLHPLISERDKCLPSLASILPYMPHYMDTSTF
jgi:dTDP-4-dehydrorhamnose 3,5-epimerase